MAKQRESVLRQIRKEATRQTRGFPREFKRQLAGFGDEAGDQLTGGWGNALARQIFGGRRRSRRHR
jgi:hypothetical protein